MKTNTFNKIKAQIVNVMNDELVYDYIKKQLENKYKGFTSENGSTIEIDDMEYFFDITGRIVKESGCEVGTTFGYDEKTLSYEVEIEYELDEIYYYVERTGGGKLKMTGLLTDLQIETINKLIN